MKNSSTSTNKITIHEAAVIALQNFGEASTFQEIYRYILENDLFPFGAKKEDPAQVLKRVIERKCINSNLAYKTKELLFYKKRE